MSRPPNYEFQEWWNQQRSKDQADDPLCSSTSEDIRFLTVNIHSPTYAAASAAAAAEKDRSRSARQLSWIYLLKLNQIAHSLAFITNGFISLIRTTRRRISTSPGPPLESKGVEDSVEYIYANWLEIRANYLAPLLQCLTNVCIVLFLIQSVDRLVLVLGCFYIKLRGLRPVAEMDYKQDDENGGLIIDHYPMVLVQIPMCNEREVYQQSIAAVCIQDWPRERMLVQVLDDSDDADVQSLIKAEVQKWQHRGVHIIYRHRLIRTAPDFLRNTIPYFKTRMKMQYSLTIKYFSFLSPAGSWKALHFAGKDDIALVQTRWAFVNKEENLLTRLQNINLAFHFEVEQQVNGWFINFFGFNGTAGVWRIKALEDCGGWLDRTTVEDMDIAVRAHLCGWKFIYLNDVKCLCELPESYEAYKKQQHRWHSGPMQLFRLCFYDILHSKVHSSRGEYVEESKPNISLLPPSEAYPALLLVHTILHYSPLTMFLPEAQLPSWVVCYIPGLVSILNILPSPQSFPFIVPYLLFENTMSVTKFNAMISGLFQLGSSYEWIVTKKLGRSSEADLVAIMENESTPLVENGMLRSNSESGLADLNNLMSAQGIHFYFLLFQGITFLIVGLDLIGEQIGFAVVRISDEK
ncbi:hypothetical protein DH2020_024398 [Rehmannia glutinosa]|uniref:Glycosyltransferase 2-like domain-containing protein n=1 Tax=Rehmannia glutinosa TaxID=99300 RepID=A0ABR0W2H1_REHGL